MDLILGIFSFIGMGIVLTSVLIIGIFIGIKKRDKDLAKIFDEIQEFIER